MDSKNVEKEITNKYNEIIDLLNSLPTNNSDSVKTIENVWHHGYELVQHNYHAYMYYIAQKYIKEFFKNHKYNCKLYVSDEGGDCFKIHTLYVPICYVCVRKGTVSLFTLDTMEKEFDRQVHSAKERKEKNEQQIKNIHSLIDLSDWQLFTREIKMRSYVSFDKIKKFREKMDKKIKEINEDIENSEKNISKMNLLKNDYFDCLYSIQKQLKEDFLADDFIIEDEPFDNECYCCSFFDSVEEFSKKNRIDATVEFSRESGYKRIDKIPKIENI